MSRKYISAIFGVLVLLGYGCQQEGKHPVRERSLNIEGTYILSGNVHATLDIRPDDSRYTVALSGGSPDTAGAGAPADCYVQATGELKGNTMMAVFAPVETDIFSYSRTQAEKEKRRLEIVFDHDTAEVIQADTFGYCGLGVSFLGRYDQN